MYIQSLHFAPSSVPQKLEKGLSVKCLSEVFFFKITPEVSSFGTPPPPCIHLPGIVRLLQRKAQHARLCVCACAHGCGLISHAQMLSSTDCSLLPPAESSAASAHPHPPPFLLFPLANR